MNYSRVQSNGIFGFAIAKAAQEFEIPPTLRFKIAVTKLADKKARLGKPKRNVCAPTTT
jgi:hypothetical protein